MRRAREEESPSSSIDSSKQPCPSDACSSICHPSRRNLITDLRLGICPWTPTTQLYGSFCEREYPRDWPPIKPLLRSTLAGRAAHRRPSSFFVKVYMEGLPIGRKVDLLAHQGYQPLLRTLGAMFRTVITCPDLARSPCKKTLVLTYEDKEGDWMAVGDVPWEMFLTSATRLKITPAEKC